MGFFKSNAILAKAVNDVIIIFWDRESIYVQNTRNGQWTLFHRYFAPRGSYNRGWRQFRHLLLYEWDHLTYAHCYRLAFRLEILSKVVAKGPDLTGKEITRRYKHNTIKKVNKGD